MRATGAALAISLAATQAAGDIDLIFPVDCTLGADCFIQQYVDHDTGPGAQDFTCGPLSYDGHKGTDVALPELSAIEAGVAVLAAAAGVVSGIRDGEPDTGLSGLTPGKECGNGVVLDHSGGWVTQYCHLKNGSMRVALGQSVAARTPLGEIGLSGKTEFPHLQFSVRYNDRIVDPFAAGPDYACNAPRPDALWSRDIPYQPGGVLSLGVSDGVPDFDAVKAGRVPDLIPSTYTPALVLFAHMFGTRSGDAVTLKLAQHDRKVFDHRFELDRTQARSFRAFGLRMPDTGWPRATYRGSAELEREGRIISRQSIEFQVR